VWDGHSCPSPLTLFSIVVAERELLANLFRNFAFGQTLKGFLWYYAGRRYEVFMRKTAIALSTLLLLTASATLASAQGTYTQLDYPKAIDTYCFGINAAGDVVGYYEGASGNYHGFLLSGGTFTSIDGPDADASYAVGINDGGQIVGSYRVTRSSIFYGFHYDPQTHTLATFLYPLSNVTFPTAINNNDIIVGYAGVASGNTDSSIAFELSGSTFVEIAPPSWSRCLYIRAELTTPMTWWDL
jgi:probable HAF family extracellular repeat protein